MKKKILLKITIIYHAWKSSIVQFISIHQQVALQRFDTQFHLNHPAIIVDLIMLI